MEIQVLAQHVGSNEIRGWFCHAMSEMYQSEVAQYGALIKLVADVNAETLRRDSELRKSLERNGEIDRLSVERHGAIRLATARELFDVRRVFAVMGMHPVGYYDLSAAGLPVHSTAFRAIDEGARYSNPFRIFASLLRLDLIKDALLLAEVRRTLVTRQIFTPRALELVSIFEAESGLTQLLAKEFVREVLDAFRWHNNATVSVATYKRLYAAHSLIADVVSFKGPHINHLTLHTLDIDAVQAGMPKRGIAPKAVIEGPPRRACPILLRQTSFKALEEVVLFQEDKNRFAAGIHAARFGEIEQRGVALTRKGRKLYDELLASMRRSVQDRESNDDTNDVELTDCFRSFPDDWKKLRSQGLAFFRYSATPDGIAVSNGGKPPLTVGEMIEKGLLRFEPMVYEDFLPVSAAGIFQSNLGTNERRDYATYPNRAEFEAALGMKVYDEFELYAQAENASLDRALNQLGSLYVAREAIV